LCAEGRKLTYAQLGDAARSVAHHLAVVPGHAGTPALLLLDHGADLVVAILAALAAGRCFCVLDPSHPLARLRVIAEASGGELLVTPPRHRELACELSGGRLEVYELDAAPARHSPARLPAWTADSTACILYTSGSTGEPKGVMQSHAGLLAEVRTLTALIGLTAEDRCSHLLSATVIGGLREILATLLTGGTLYPFDLRTGGAAAFLRLIARERITVCRLVPTTLRYLVDHLSGAEDLSSLRAVYVGGEPLFPADARRFRERFPRECELVNILGATETGIFAAHEIGPDDLEDRPVPAGRPVAGVDVELIRGDGRRAAPGEIGEIVVCSRFLSPGYWRQPELTDAAFAVDGSTGMRRYRTGDLGYLRADGLLVHAGRRDHQVQIRGHRIEVAEVEGALRALPYIRDAAVAVLEGASEPQLVAYVQLSSGHRESSLGAALQQRLPRYMVPSRITVVDAIPRTANGKVDHPRLRSLGQTQSQLEFVAPRDDIERRIAAIWEKLLRKRPIGAFDDFFALGGHSLIAVHFLAQLGEEVGRDLPLSTLVSASTVAALAECVRGTALPCGRSLVPLQETGSRPPLFCVHGIGGGVLCYRALAQALGPEQRFFGLQAPELGGYPAEFRSIPEMARLYLAEVREVQPQGPYYLSGLSFGGNVAWEMAQQLQAAGEQVALLALLDSRGPGYPRFPAAPVRAARHLANLVRLNPAARAEYLRIRMKAVRNLWSRYVLGRVYGRRRQDARTLPGVLQDIGLAHYQAFCEYERLPYSGRVTLFRAGSQPVGCDFDPHNGWKPLALGGIDVLEVPGEHAEIVEAPYVTHLAAQLRVVLDRLHEQA
jgi:amino acid adenylation domain-containing protein